MPADDPQLFQIVNASVRSMAALDNELFVAFDNANGIDIYEYDTNSWKLQKHIYSQLSLVNGLACCPVNKCLYATNGYMTLYKINLENMIENSIQIEGAPVGVSVNTSNNVVVVCSVTGLVKEFDKNLKFIRKIDLFVRLKNPYQAVQVGNNSNDPRLTHYVICGDGKVILVSSIQELSTYGEDNNPELLDDPIGLQQLSNGSILVTDLGNSRVLLLDKSLNFIRVMRVSMVVNGTKVRPGAVYFYEKTGQLCIGTSDCLLIYLVSHIAELT